jgi:hypothetical protein
MLRITIYMTLIVNLMLGAASAQERPHIQGVPGYTDPLRTDLEKKNDREIDRAYRSTVKGMDVEKRNLIRGPMFGQRHQRRPRISNNG